MDELQIRTDTLEKKVEQHEDKISELQRFSQGYLDLRHRFLEVYRRDIKPHHISYNPERIMSAEAIGFLEHNMTKAGLPVRAILLEKAILRR